MRPTSQNKKALLINWVMNLIALDGLLPVAVFLTPVVLDWTFMAFPKIKPDQSILGLILITIPIIAFFYRCRVGIAMLDDEIGCLALLAFPLGLFVLAFGEVMYIGLTHGIVVDRSEVLIATSVCWAIYFVCMAFAFFPRSVFST